jgi:CDP-glucose 4,6-dehydratase
MTESFWRGKRVLITGHTGFKGSWLSLWLTRMGAQVSGYALAPATQPSLFELARVAGGMDSTIGDVRDLAALAACLARAAPDVVFHLAAQALVRDSYRDPVETFATNVMGTVNVFEAIRRMTAPPRVVINITSDKCYENREWVWGYRENDPMGGHDPYSASKGCAELVTASMRRSFFPPEKLAEHGVAVASVRAGNVIGGGDWAKDRLVPDMIRAFSESRPVIIRYPNATRPWQHVLEPLSGYLCLAERLWQPADAATFADGWNFGPADDDSRSVGWITAALCKRWGQGATWQTPPDVQPHEAHSLRLDCAKARTLLHWRPRWSLDATLEHIVAWHQAHLAGNDMRTVTLDQIRAYEETPA